MTSRDLKDLLQTLASDGTDRVPVDEQTLIPRIRSRRRRRTGIAAAVAASTAVVVAAGAYAVLPGADQEQPPAAAPPVPTVTLKPHQENGFVCGSRLTAPIAGDPTLGLAVTQQTVTPDANGVMASINVELINSAAAPVNLSGSPAGASLVVVKDGIVVATPLAERAIAKRWKFGPNETVTVKTFLSIRQCTTDGQQGTVPLEPGTYQLYATKSFKEISELPKLPDIVIAGGPWTIELK
ncbi:hypothetical protein GCM10009554_22590 [Kribbella koreensis]|uniref:Uncharacterized protein n=1 Tax=Kribbella koreensis TaxID=57909 RepID=A0ABN1Q0M5_9ACTN